jgi:hypothetical protein
MRWPYGSFQVLGHAITFVLAAGVILWVVANVLDAILWRVTGDHLLMPAFRWPMESIGDKGVVP